MRYFAFLLIVVVLSYLNPALAGSGTFVVSPDVDFGTGADGDLMVPAGQVLQTDSVKSPVVESNPAGVAEIRVARTTGFNVGDEILIISMQDSEVDIAQNVSGQYETHRVVGVSDTTLQLDAPLEHSFNADDNHKHQVLRVPNYADVTVEGTLTCDGWDGAIGGVLVFRAAGTVRVNPGGLIDARGKGYRGSPRTLGIVQGQQGESISGGFSRQTAQLNGAGGGGTGSVPALVGSGGGGGYGTSGQIGFGLFLGGQGGVAFGQPELAQLLMGAGGGGGGKDTVSTFGGAGGAGGGILLIFASNFINQGKVSTSGFDGGNGFGAGAASGGGGGAGGSLWVRTQQLVNDGMIEAIGGAGGPPTVGLGVAGPGGRGGVGRIRLDADAMSGSGTINPPPFLGST